MNSKLTSVAIPDIITIPVYFNESPTFVRSTLNSGFGYGWKPQISV